MSTQRPGPRGKLGSRPVRKSSPEVNRSWCGCLSLRTRIATKPVSWQTLQANRWTARTGINHRQASILRSLSGVHHRARSAACRSCRHRRRRRRPLGAPRAAAPRQRSAPADWRDLAEAEAPQAEAGWDQTPWRLALVAWETGSSWRKPRVLFRPDYTRRVRFWLRRAFRQARPELGRAS